MKGMAAILMVLLPLTLVILVVFAKRQPAGDLDKQGLVLFNAADYDGAIETWEKGLEFDPDSVLLLNRIGVAFTQKKDYSAAEDTFLKAIKIDPDYPQSHFNLGLLHLCQGNEPQAVDELKETLRCASWYPETHYHLGLIYEKQGRLDLAEEEYIAELNVNPNCTKAWGRYFILKGKTKSTLPAKVIEE